MFLEAESASFCDLSLVEFLAPPWMSRVSVASGASSAEFQFHLSRVLNHSPIWPLSSEARPTRGSAAYLLLALSIAEVLFFWSPELHGLRAL